MKSKEGDPREFDPLFSRPSEETGHGNVSRTFHTIYGIDISRRPGRNNEEKVEEVVRLALGEIAPPHNRDCRPLTGLLRHATTPLIWAAWYDSDRTIYIDCKEPDKSKCDQCPLRSSKFRVSPEERERLLSKRT